MRCLPVVLILFFSSFSVFAQHGLADSGMRVTMIGAVYSFNIPGGDMAKRFGVNSTIGGAFWHKTASNWLIGGEYNFLFGGIIKEGQNPLDSISTSDGQLINNEGTYQLYRIYERGHLPLIKVGKVLPLLNPNPNAGVTVKLGVGYLEHRIRYYWEGQDPPQVRGDYVKGYDRYTSGLVLTQSAGYLYLHPKNSFNFSVDLEVAEGFTKSRRTWDYDQMSQDTKKRLDMFYGIKVAWYFPFYKRSSDGYYYE
jgi:hypothetical protein